MQEPRRPNILVIITDMQRYDTLGCYGNDLIRTPNIDALAAEGVRFTNYFSNNPVCMPNRATLMTGRLPSAHGIRWNMPVKLPEHEVTLQEKLRDAGYQTAGIGHVGRRGFEYFNSTARGGSASPGVSTYQQRLAQAGISPVPRPQDDPEYKKYYGAVTSPLPEEHHVDGFIARATQEFLRSRDRERPFFCWCSFDGPHLPIDPAHPWDRLYDPSAIPLPKWLPDELDNKPPEQRAFQRNPHRRNGFGDCTTLMRSPDILKRFIAYYWGKVSMIDHFIGGIIAELHQTGDLDNTIVLFTSDHGDFLGHHGMMFKGAFLYDDLVRVPLIVYSPSRFRPRAVDKLVESIDIPYTLLRLAGVSAHEGMQGDDFTPLLEGRDVPWRKAAYAEAVDKRMLRTHDWKLVHYQGKPYGELYNLHEDPEELVNLYSDPRYQGTLHQLRAMLIDRMMVMEERQHPAVPYQELDDPDHPGVLHRRVRLPWN